VVDRSPAGSPTAGAGPHAESPDPEHRGPRRLTFGEHLWAFSRELAAVVIGAVIVSSLLRAFVGQMFLIPSISMQNTLQVSDRVVVEKITKVQRGEVVVFEDPGGWLTGPPPPQRGSVGQVLEFIGVLPDTGTEHLIKRVIGLPGDRVACCDTSGRITVNDQPLEESSYLYTDPAGRRTQPSSIPFDVVVPAGRIFVLGDNRSRSRDSRCHLAEMQPGGARGDNAFVSLDLVVGHAVAVVWPPADLTSLRVPSTFGSVPSGKNPAPARAIIANAPGTTC
jgi:signal peptidase I